MLVPRDVEVLSEMETPARFRRVEVGKVQWGATGLGGPSLCREGPMHDPSSGPIVRWKQAFRNRAGLKSNDGEGVVTTSG